MGKNTVIVVGGGASGLTASIVAARQGAKVILLERMNRIGKKILATGNGRCNITNMNLTIDNYHGTNPEFALPALNKFDVEKTINFFKELGVYPKLENGYVYPYSNQASSVLNILRYEVERLGVNIICEEEAKEIIIKKNQFIVKTSKNKYYGTKVILSTGGKSSPNLGSNGSGLKLARELGHTIIKPIPGLVQLEAKEKYLKQIKGVKIQGKITLCNQNEKVTVEKGEILFTDYGLSGIPVLQLSRFAGKLIENNKNPHVFIDFMPEENKRSLDNLLIERFKNMPFKTLGEGLEGLFNKRLIPVLVKISDCSLNKSLNQLTKEERIKLVENIKNLRLNIIGTRQWHQSQVTVGGVSTEEINPNTMESKKVPNLFFSGEIIDIDADCGGYNLQWAWSSGYLAGFFSTNNDRK
ncbi:MAG: NAD(P)/FAD-dependent oxidoreductase [Eubacteriales bacterium]